MLYVFYASFSDFEYFYNVELAPWNFYFRFLKYFVYKAEVTNPIGAQYDFCNISYANQRLTNPMFIPNAISAVFRI